MRAKNLNKKNVKCIFKFIKWEWKMMQLEIDSIRKGLLALDLRMNILEKNVLDYLRQLLAVQKSLQQSKKRNRKRKNSTSPRRQV